MAKRPFSALPAGGIIAFEAIARLGSFKAAAQSLSVTPAAVSQRVRALEDHLGLRLFQRLNREVRMTADGHKLTAAVSDAFQMIDAVLDSFESSNGVLRVSAAPTFATKWLASRLDRFQSHHPRVLVTLSATNECADVEHDPSIDVALRYGTGPYPGVYVEKILSNQLCVCGAPALVTGSTPLRHPSDVARHVLLRSLPPTGSDGTPSPWAAWLSAAGVGSIAEGGPAFSNSQMAIEAALAGRGLALVPEILVAEDISAGRLSQPFALTVPDPFSFWFVCRTGRAETRPISQFRRWLLAELPRSRDRPAPTPLVG